MLILAIALSYQSFCLRPPGPGGGSRPAQTMNLGLGTMPLFDGSFAMRLAASRESVRLAARGRRETISNLA